MCTAQIPAQNCDHFIDLANPRCNGTREPIAELVDFRVRDGNSLGVVLALSQCGERIAIADWDTVCVWAVDAAEIWHACGTDYFTEQHRVDGVGKLYPQILPKAGVVHKLIWVNNDILYGLTDRGLVRWDISVYSTGKRTHSVMDLRQERKGDGWRGKVASPEETGIGLSSFAAQDGVDLKLVRTLRRKAKGRVLAIQRSPIQVTRIGGNQENGEEGGITGPLADQILRGSESGE